MGEFWLWRLTMMGLAAAGGIAMVVAVMWLREHGIYPLRTVMRIFRRPWVEAFLLLFCVGGLVQYGATKGTNGSGGVSSPSSGLMMSPAPVLTPVAVDSTGFLIPTDFFPVTNLCFWGIEKGSNFVSLGFAWPVALPLTNGYVDLYGNWQLSSNGWLRLAQVDVSAARSNAVVQLTIDSFPTNAMENSAFFRLASQDDADGDCLSDKYEEWVSGTDPQSSDTDDDGIADAEEANLNINPLLADSDGDGLSDGEEIGYIAKSVGFEWYDTTGFAMTYARRQFGFESYIGANIDSQLSGGTVILDIPLTGALSLENGSIYLYSSGHGQYWIYPEAIGPLNENVYDMGDIFIAPYWCVSSLQYGDQTSFIRTGIVTSNCCFVAEFHNVKRNQWTDERMTYQVIVPGGTGNVVRISYHSADFWMDGVGAVVGVQNKQRITTNGYYNLTWYFDERGPILPGTTIEYHLGYGTDPMSADTDGDGLDDAFETQVFHSDPLQADADGDGLTDAEERTFGTSPFVADTDEDGMPDKWEVSHNFNPRVATDAGWDSDNDGLTNLEEYQYGSNPRSVDTDLDGLSDSDEVGLGTDLTNADTDKDGLNDGLELSISTNPLQPDTDGDSMDDGWEWLYCRRAGMSHLLAKGDLSAPNFDPAVNNNTDTDPDNDFDADPDEDGLSNGEECENRTGPTNPDTDGDGVTDGGEVGQGSDPSDATDGGRPNSRVAVHFTFGDPSGSHSEKYLLKITPMSGQGEEPASFSWLNANYGECETRTARLKAGWKYEVRLTWAACNQASDGSYYPNYDYTLSLGQDIPKGVVLDDPGNIFRSDYHGDEYYGASHFPILDAVATITVYAVTKVAVCDPNDQSWVELEDSRVVLDDEELRIKVEIAPQIKTLAQCRQMFGDALIVKTSGTCPSGASVPIGDDAMMNNSADTSEIRITKTRQQLISLGLLPAKNEDGVSEMAWLDMASGTGQSLADSEAFAGLGYADRGTASTMDSTHTLDSTPPNSKPSESYFKAAGREIVMVDYGGMTSERWQLMNQADVFYFSGHGNHDGNSIQGGFTPTMAHKYWNRDLNIAIIAGCSVLDINDYNDNYSGASHTLSPGEEWERAGPDILLGYAFIAPGDAGGAPTRIVNQWCANHAASGDVNAWMDANAANHAWNACAIVKGQKYVYFKKVFFKKFKKLQEVSKGEW